MTYDGETHREAISVLPSGLTGMADKDGKTAFGFAPLDGEGRRFVAWERDRDAPPGDNSQTYMLVERRANGEFVWYFPKCGGDEAEIAQRAGAAVHKGTVDECRFPTRASLESAMRNVEISGEVMRLVRVSD